MQENTTNKTDTVAFSTRDSDGTTSYSIDTFFKNLKSLNLADQEIMLLDLSGCDLSKSNYSSKLNELIKTVKTIHTLNLENTTISHDEQNNFVQAVLENANKVGIVKLAGKQFNDETKRLIDLNLSLYKDTKDDLIMPLVKLLIIKAKEGKYLYGSTEKQQENFTNTLHHNLFELYKTEYDYSKRQNFINFLKKIEKKEPFTKEEQLFLREAASAISANFKAITHESWVGRFAQNIWIFFASKFFTRKKGNDQFNGYTKLISTQLEGKSFLYKVTQSMRDMGEDSKDVLPFTFIDEIIARAKNNKFLYNIDESKLITFKQEVSQSIFKAYDKDYYSTMKKFAEFLKKFENETPAFTKEENEFLDKCASELKSNFKEIKHDSLPMRFAQNIWILFASIFFTREKSNDQWNGYTTLIEQKIGDSFAEKVQNSIMNDICGRGG